MCCAGFLNHLSEPEFDEQIERMRFKGLPNGVYLIWRVYTYRGNRIYITPD